jgi:hypothetical protein
MSAAVMRTLICWLPVALALGGCAAQKTAPQTETRSRIGEAVTAWLVDLNLLRTEIPPVLVDARQNPYAPVAEPDCRKLTEQIFALDEVLGADLDVPKANDEPSLFERGSTEAGDAAIGAIRDVAVGWIPYRGWVRRLTGAERHSKEVAAAIAAGVVRRAYLKGMGTSLGCAPPAAPLPPTPCPEPPPDPSIDQP